MQIGQHVCDNLTGNKGCNKNCHLGSTCWVWGSGVRGVCAAPLVPSVHPPPPHPRRCSGPVPHMEPLLPPGGPGASRWPFALVCGSTAVLVAAVLLLDAAPAALWQSGPAASSSRPVTRIVHPTWRRAQGEPVSCQKRLVLATAAVSSSSMFVGLIFWRCQAYCHTCISR